MSKENGRSLSIRLLGGAVLVLLLAIGGWQATTLRVVGKSSEDHAKEPGHPVLVQRMDGIDADVAAIKRTQEAMRAEQRTMRETQIEQGVILRDIAKKVER